MQGRIYSTLSGLIWFLLGLLSNTTQFSYYYLTFFFFSTVGFTLIFMNNAFPQQFCSNLTSYQNLLYQNGMFKIIYFW